MTDRLRHLPERLRRAAPPAHWADRGEVLPPGATFAAPRAELPMSARLRPAVRPSRDAKANRRFRALLAAHLFGDRLDGGGNGA